MRNRLQTILCPTTAFPSTEDKYADKSAKEVLAKQKGDKRSILTLRVLVQNRRKDHQSVVVYSAISQIAAQESSLTGRALKYNYV